MRNPLRSSGPTVPTPDPDRLYVCLVGHVSEAGSYRRGETLRGSHPGPRACPVNWVEQGLPDDELAALMAARGIPAH